MGRTLTHKTIVIEMALSGMSTQQIARRIFHTPEAVDQYLRLFDLTGSWCCAITGFHPS
jgi:hypothetical protein